MRHALSAVAAVFLILALTLGSIFATSAPTPAAAQAQGPEACIINVLGVKVCGTLLGEPLTEIVEVTVPGPTITLPPVTVTDVVTVRPDPIKVTVTPDPVRVTETITPAPVRVTETVTAAPAPQGPQPTATATATETQVVEGPNRSDNGPQATVTETVRPNGQPVPTVTETVTPEPTGQEQPQSATVEPDDDEPFLSPEIDFGDSSVTAGEAGVGLLGALLIFGLVVAGMYYGFTRGVATANREDAYFLREVLQKK